MEIYDVAPLGRPAQAVQLGFGNDAWMEMFTYLESLLIRAVLHINTNDVHDQYIQVGYEYIMRTGDWLIVYGPNRYEVVDVDDFEDRWRILT